MYRWRKVNAVVAPGNVAMFPSESQQAVRKLTKIPSCVDFVKRTAVHRQRARGEIPSCPDR